MPVGKRAVVVVRHCRLWEREIRWEYEPYEIFCCEQAVLIAAAIKQTLGVEAMDRGVAEDAIEQYVIEGLPEEFKEYANLPYAEQVAAVPGLSDGHSDNTLSCSMILAFWYLGEQPENVIKVHGAMAPLVGCKNYGCVSADEDTE